jgi:hypothetical protein
MTSTHVRDYYARITAIDIGQVARELLADRLTVDRGPVLRFDCPHHASQSKASLIVDTETQAFWCKGCDAGGDVLHLVEFVQSGQVTSHRRGAMPESHRRARDTLASLQDLPPLSESSLSPEEQKKAEELRREADAVFSVLTDLAAFYHRKLLDRPDVLEWLAERYAIGEASVERLHIGFADNEGLFDGYLHGEKGHPWTAITASGCAVVSSRQELYPFFRGRIIFPYWKQGRVVYLIGRKTPWTPDNRYETAKYKKLPTHSARRDYISPAVRNDVFYNEDCLVTERGEVVITEGVTDCIALAERGIACISPVTVTFRDQDHEKLLSLVKHVERVVICQDNEVSGVGLAGALKTAKSLSRGGVDVQLLELPLGERQRAAREELAQRGIIEGATHEEIDEAKAALDEAGQAEVDRLLAEAKIDLNDYLLSASTDDFRALLSEALPPIHWQIAKLDPDPPDVRVRNEQLKPVAKAIAELGPLDQDECVERLRQHYSPSMRPTKKVLVETIKQYARELRAEDKEGAAFECDAPADSCKYLIARMEHNAWKDGISPDWNAITEAAYDWFVQHGATFFRDREGRVYLCFENRVHEMVPSPATHRSYLALMFQHTGLNCMTPSGRVFFETLANLAFLRGQRKESFMWSHTDHTAHTVYFNLNNDQNQLVKISPDGVELLPNGSNDDNVLLTNSSKVMPIHFLPDVDLEEADRQVAELVCDNLTCADNERLLTIYWLSAFLLLDFAGTRPMLRFEGPKESGKSTASKILSALIYGQEQHKRSTTAANYADAAVNPLVLLDNIETKNATDSLIDFLLTAVTKIANEKRKRGTDSETVIEFAKCLVNTSGIEPLAGDLSELVSRTFIVEFDLRHAQRDDFLETEVIHGIRAARDTILSALFQRTHRALRLMRDGAQGRVMRLLSDTLGRHSKRRANDYIALMYLTMIATGDDEQIERDLERLDPLFVAIMQTQQEAATDVQVGSNPIVTLLQGLFREYARAVRADQKSFASGGDSHVEKFSLAYHLDFDDERTLSGVQARDLHVALSLFAKNKGLNYPYRNPKQLGRRLNNDLDTLAEAGLTVISLPGHGNRLTYHIELEETADDGSERGDPPNHPNRA